MRFNPMNGAPIVYQSVWRLIAVAKPKMIPIHSKSVSLDRERMESGIKK